MIHLHPLDPSLTLPVSAIGAKAAGLVTMLRLGLPVPPGLVIDTAACRHFLDGGHLPAGLDRAVMALVAASAALGPCVADPFSFQAAPVRSAAEPVGGGSLVSVRSGAAVSMPGMMNTLLNVAVHDVRSAVSDVFSSWRTPRAITYRELHGIDHGLGTAVIVQAMVYGDRDSRSGSGVAFSRDPRTGDRTVFGEVLFGRQGDAVVAGESVTQPLSDLAAREPAVWAGLVEALARLERHHRDVCHVEFTYESGRLWFLQVRAGGLVGRAAVRAAVSLVDEGTIDRAEAMSRISSRDVELAHACRIRAGDRLDVIARGHGASPGVAAGRIALTADSAVRMAADGPVVLVRPSTSPLDMHGLAAAVGVVTSRGGPTSHAAVVARSLGRPAVVGAARLVVDEAGRCVHAGSRVVPEGTFVTIDGAAGEMVTGDPGSVPGEEDPHLRRLLSWRS